jgi:hypothetical protein
MFLSADKFTGTVVPYYIFISSLFKPSSEISSSSGSCNCNPCLGSCNCNPCLGCGFNSV